MIGKLCQLASVIALLLALAPTVRATTLVVTNAADSGADGLRKANSGFDGGANRSVLTNLPGFTEDYAIALSPAAESFGGLWKLAAGGNNSLIFSNSVNLSPLVNNAVAYTFSFPVAAIGLQPGGGGTFRYFGTLISSTGFRSDEALPGNVSGAQGWSPFNVTAVASYTIAGHPGGSVVPSQLAGLTRLGDGTFQFAFTNLGNASFTVLASTNVALPLNLWTNLGPAVETPPASGQYQFTTRKPRTTCSASTASVHHNFTNLIVQNIFRHD